jgi:hypothetical protein
MRVHMLFEIEVSEMRAALDGNVGVAVGNAMMRALNAVEEEHDLSARLIRAERIDAVPERETETQT